MRLRLLLVAGLSLLLGSCSDGDRTFRQESFVFGTRVDIQIADADSAQAQSATRAVLARFDALHRKLHAWQPSDLESLNAAFSSGQRAPVDAELSALLNEVRAQSELGEGLFNPAIGNLIRLWGFHADLPQTQSPDPGAISKLVRAAPSMRDIHIERGQVWSDNPAVRLDLGGYAKGLALDEAAAILKRHGVRHALINIGGNVLALGTHGQRPWRVGIQHPRGSGVIATLELRDGEAIGTSGDYQRYFEAGGKRYCHLIDPRSGHPAEKMQSVTILTQGDKSGMRSDVQTKPLFIAGVSELTRLSGKLGIRHVLAVDAQGKVWVSDTLRQRLQWSDAKQPFEQLR